MNLDSLSKLYVHELKDLYSAEKQLVSALPKVIAAARNKDLKKALKDHLQETRRQVQRLEKVFDRVGASPRGHKCMGMEGLIKESASMLKEDAEPDVLDAAIIADKAMAALPADHPDRAFYLGKRYAAQYFVGNIVATVPQKAQLIGKEDRSPLDIPTAAFATV